MHSIGLDRTQQSQFVTLAGQELVAFARLARPHFSRDLHVHAPLLVELRQVVLVKLE